MDDTRFGAPLSRLPKYPKAQFPCCRIHRRWQMSAVRIETHSFQDNGLEYRGAISLFFWNIIASISTWMVRCRSGTESGIRFEDKTRTSWCVSVTTIPPLKFRSHSPFLSPPRLPPSLPGYLRPPFCLIRDLFRNRQTLPLCHIQFLSHKWFLCHIHSHPGESSHYFAS